MNQEAGAGTLGSRLRVAARDAFGTPAFGGLLACCLVLGLASSFVVPFLSLWGTQAVGMSAPLFASFMTVNAVCGLAASTLLARQSDTRWSRRSVLLIGGSGGALGYFGYAFVREPLLLMAVGASLHSLSAVSFSQIFAHAREELARSTRPEKASFALGVLRAAFSLAWTVGPALGALLVERYGYRGTFLSAAGLMVLYLALVLGSVPVRLPEGTAAAEQCEPVWRLLARRQLLINFLAFVLIFSAVSLNLMNLPLLLTHDLGGSERQVGTAFAVAPVLEIPLMLWLGRMPRARHSLLIRGGVMVGLAYFLVLGWARAPEHVYLAQALNAVTVAVTMSLAIGYFQDMMPGQTGLATSVYTNSWSLGSLVAYFSFGLLAEPLGQRGLTRFCATLAGVSFLVLLVASRRAPSVATPVASQ